MPGKPVSFPEASAMLEAHDSWRHVMIFIFSLWSYRPFNAAKKLSPGTVKIVFTPEFNKQFASILPPSIFLAIFASIYF